MTKRMIMNLFLTIVEKVEALTERVVISVYKAITGEIHDKTMIVMKMGRAISRGYQSDIIYDTASGFEDKDGVAGFPCVMKLVIGG